MQQNVNTFTSNTIQSYSKEIEYVSDAEYGDESLNNHTQYYDDKNDVNDNS